MAHTADIFDDQDRWGRPLGASIAFHITVVVLVTVWASLHRGFTIWGQAGAGAAGSISVTAVDSIPLPSPVQSQTTNVLANQSKGITQSPPKQETKPVEDAIPIAGRVRPKKPKEAEQASNRPQPPQPQPPQPSNQVAYGEGGPANAVQFNMGNGTGGLSVTGTGDFAGLYGWYVDQVRQKLSQNWFLYQVDPTVPKGSRVTVSFEITRSGQPANVSLKQSSGYSTLDSSAMAALKRVDTFGALPNDYRGNSVRVDFYFEK
ncbi:MAG TPA: TonB family protein [Terriglobales bacterium]|nr:TonB family protein [Terriglobales bacterium]